MNSDSNAERRPSSAGREGLGRRIMLALGATLVAVCGGIGWFVGSNGASVVSEAAILGTGVTVPVTPLAMALYGVVVSALLLGALFGLVELVSRAEDVESASADSGTGGDR